uniref:Uncharacterized protein n=1 Tax=Arundo donax TaxID=35708 RepID=A0A0A9B3S9_ARUDO
MCLPHIAAATHPLPCAVPSHASCRQQLYPSPIPSSPQRPPLPLLPSTAAPPLLSAVEASRDGIFAEPAKAEPRWPTAESSGRW